MNKTEDTGPVTLKKFAVYGRFLSKNGLIYDRFHIGPQRNTMKDRMDFLHILSLLIAGAFLISVINPVSASADAGRQTRITSILAAHGVAETNVGHEFVGFTPGMPDSAWPDRGSVSLSGVDRDALLNTIRSGPGLQPVPLPDSGFNWPVITKAVPRNRSMLIDDLIGSHQKPGSGLSRIYSGEGTVRFINLEGGFYGIVTSSGERFIPDNLPRALLEDGIAIRFTAVVGNQEPGITMWGRTIHLISSEKIDRTISKQGTIHYIDLEGGFYGIIASTGEKYLPMNLAPEFRVDGLPVEFTARERLDLGTTAMWGVPVDLITIRAIGQQAAPITGSWTLVRYYDGSVWRTPVPGSEITAAFSDDGRLNGSAGCNRYFASYEANGSGLTVGPVGSTEMYCAGTMGQETAYLRLLGNASSYTVGGDILTISDQNGRPILTFEKAVTDGSNPETILVEFSRTGGFAGCNDHLVLAETGNAKVTRKDYTTRITVPEEEVTVIAALLENAGIPGLRDDYPAPQEGADLFTYTLTYQGKTIHMEETAVPEVLLPIIDILCDIIVTSAPDDIAPPF